VTESLFFKPFEDLDKIIENKEIKIASEPSQSINVISVSDEDLFQNAMKEVREIREFRQIALHPKKVITLCKKNFPDEEALITLKEIVSGKRTVNLPDTQEYVEWINHKYKGNLTRKLHEGLFSVQDCLDLHGLILDNAKMEVEKFIKGSLKKRLRCIKIIHGRGLRSPNGPVLKHAVIKWLLTCYKKNIIAFATARPCDGGLGALYILLE
jgi:DNA-nicking Smr family endonuclease